jgi:hypothetical protein
MSDPKDVHIDVLALLTGLGTNAWNGPTQIDYCPNCVTGHSRLKVACEVGCVRSGLVFQAPAHESTTVVE